MDVLKKHVTEYCALKEELKQITDRKNQLEKTICSTMDEFSIDTLQLPNGNALNYKVKESLVLSKERTKSTKPANST